MTTNVDWAEIFRRRPELAPPGYADAVQAGQERSKERYERLGKKRAKGSNSRKPVTESRQATDRRRRFPSLKHGSD